METTSAVSALTTGLGAVAADAMEAIGAVLPIALPIMGAGVVIFIGVKLFKRFAK